jgi:ATP-dependent Zn protease
LEGQNRGSREPLGRNRRRQVPLRAWVGFFVLVLVVNLLFAFCGVGAQAQIPFSDFVNEVKSDNVKTAVFLGSQITGEFVHPVNGHSDFLTEEPPGDVGLVQLLLNHHAQVSATESAFQWLGNSLNLLSVLLMLFLLGSIAYQARTGQRLGYGIGQSRARMHTQGRPKITFAGGASNEKATEVRETVDRAEVDAIVPEAEGAPASPAPD